MKWIIIIATIICVGFAIIEMNWGRIALYLLNRKLDKDLKKNIKRNEKFFQRT